MQPPFQDPPFKNPNSYISKDWPNCVVCSAWQLPSKRLIKSLLKSITGVITL